MVEVAHSHYRKTFGVRTGQRARHLAGAAKKKMVGEGRAMETASERSELAARDQMVGGPDRKKKSCKSR